MNIILYFIIFISKTIELTLGTLRLIVVANGKKILGAILQGIIAVVWAFVTGTVITNITGNPFKLIAFALGSAFGSYLGSLIEEHIAIGTNMLIIDSNKTSIIKKVLKDNIIFNNKKTFSIIVKRKNTKSIINKIKQVDSKSNIIIEDVYIGK